MNENPDSSLKMLANALQDKALMHGFFIQTKLSLVGVFKQPEDCFDHGNNAPTIVLSHGLFCTNNSMSQLGDILKEEYNVAYAPNYEKWNTGDMNISAQLFGKKLKTLLEENEKNGDINVVGHSLGGLIALQSLLQDEMIRVHSVSTCSTPFHGSPIGSFAFFSKAAKQMNTVGGFIPKKTNVMDSLEKLFVHIAKKDTWVPSTSHEPHENLSKNITRIDHENYTHTSFIIGDKVGDFASIIKKNVNSM